MYEKFGQFIDGKWQQSSDKSTYEVINPANEEVIGHASKATPADVDKALKSAAKGLEVSKPTPPWQSLRTPQKTIRPAKERVRSPISVLRYQFTVYLDTYLLRFQSYT